MLQLEHAGSNVDQPALMNNAATLILDERGMICDCDKSAENLLGFLRSELASLHVSAVLPQLQDNLFENGSFSSRITYLGHCGYLFQVRDRHGNVFQREIRLSEIERAEQHIFRLILCE